jgi:hypothetical protein
VTRYIDATTVVELIEVLKTLPPSARVQVGALGLVVKRPLVDGCDVISLEVSTFPLELKDWNRGEPL